MHRLEYATILFIVAAMGFIGFTEGITIGIILACLFFVVMYARRPVIRSLYTGSQLRSTVHRLYRQQTFLDKVGEQICVIKLQGFIFFGTINQLNDQIKSLMERPGSKIRFIVLDFSLISGMDYSAMVRVRVHFALTRLTRVFHIPVFCDTITNTHKGILSKNQ